MKKLIEKLEKEYKSDEVQWCDGEYRDGFNHARAIVLAHNPWILVSDECHRHEIGYHHIRLSSISQTGRKSVRGIMIMTTTHGVCMGDMDVIKWAYLPKVKR